MLIVVIFVSRFKDNSSAYIEEKGKREKAFNAKLEEEKDAFNRLTPAQHIDRAKDMLKLGNPESLNSGLEELAAIDSKAPERKDADRLRGFLDSAKKVKLRQYAAERVAEARKQTAADAAAKRVARDFMAKEMENSMLHNGYSVDVYATGPDHTTLHLKWVLVSKAMAYQLSEQGDFFSNAKAIGFKRIEISDGYRETWYWNL